MPDVYLYDRNDELIKVINMALEAQKKNIDTAWEKRAKLSSDYSKDKLLIIASILEKESVKMKEKKSLSYLQ